MSEKEVSFGIVGLDGHGLSFTEAVNGPGSALAGARVAAATPVASVMISEEALAERVERTRALGVEIVDDPAELASKADAVLILHDDGSKHLELAQRFARFGKPMFVDKPFEVTAEKARELVALCRSSRCAMFSASSLRFSAEITRVVEDEEGGAIVSAMTYSPFNEKPTMPGWIYYGVHAVEPLYTLLGPGCREVRCVKSASCAVAVGVWEDGRLGVARASSAGQHGYGFTVWRENVTENAAVDSAGLYPALLERIRTFALTGESPVDPDESVEVIAFMEAANTSMAKGGQAVRISR